MRIAVPPASGVLSAVGLVVSERRRDLVESVLLSGDGLTRDAVSEAVARLAARGRDELGEPGAEVRASYDLRYAGQAFELTVAGEPEPDIGALRDAFDAAHQERYGHSDFGARLELVTVRVAVAVPGGDLPGGGAPPAGGHATRRARFAGEWLETRVWRGAPAGEVAGPAIVELPEATLVVPPGWAGAADADGTLVLERR